MSENYRLVRLETDLNVHGNGFDYCVCDACFLVIFDDQNDHRWKSGSHFRSFSMLSKKGRKRTRCEDEEEAKQVVLMKDFFRRLHFFRVINVQKNNFDTLIAHQISESSSAAVINVT